MPGMAASRSTGDAERVRAAAPRCGSSGRRPSRARRRPLRTSPASQPPWPRPIPAPPTGISGPARRDGLGQAGRRCDRRVRVAAGPDVGDRDGIGVGEDRPRTSSSIAAVRWKVSGSYTAHDAAARLALADAPRASRGSPSGGGRSRRTPTTPAASPFRSRRRPTPANEASPRARSLRREAQRRGRGGDAQRVRRRCGARPSAAGRCGARRARRGRRSPRSCRRHRPRRSAEQDRSGSAPAANARRSRREAAERAAGRVDDARSTIAARPVPRADDASSATPASPTLAMSIGGGPLRPPAADRIHASNASITAARSANTSGWSHSADVSTATSGRYGSKLPAYSSASTTNGGPRPSAPSPARRPVSDAGSSAPTNAAGSAPAAARTCTSQPDGRALAVRPGDRDERPAGRRVGDDLLPRLERDARPRARRPAPGGPGRSRSAPS